MNHASQLRVLLIDDDEDGLELLGEVLRNAGFEVRVASAANEALRVLETFQPEVAIIDIGLPDLDGYELARQIRERTHCRLFALSGYTAQTAPKDKAVTSFDMHFVKPVVIPPLLAAIKESRTA
jgi:DNA-binding response OmpR family regulator